MEVSGDVLQAALAQAITNAVPAEMQTEIFTRALKEYLFTAGRGEKSPISTAFQEALKRATSDMATAVVNSPENGPRIRAFMQSCFEEALQDKDFMGRIVKQFANSISRY